MDYSYFSSAPQPYPFFGLPQASDQQHNTHSQTQQQLTHDQEYPLQLSTEQYDAAFAAFQQNFHYDPNAFLQHPTSAAPLSTSPTAHAQPLSSTNNRDIDHESVPLFPEPSPDEIIPGQNRSSSEEKDNLTPQQSRRKAQNRQAQRAFRERKERHVKELEAKLTNLQSQSASLNGENERLKREIARFATENEILRATSGSQTNGPTPFMTEPDELVGPLGFVPTDNHSGNPSGTPSSYGSDLSSKYAHFGTLKMLTVDDETGQPLLGAGATWDYIQSHQLFRKGLVDVGDVCERLKSLARCDGQGGPVFQESDVRRAIAESAVAGGRDELI